MTTRAGKCRQRLHYLVLVALAVFRASDAAAQAAGDIGQLSLEDLMNLEVTSVSRRSERLSDASAAVHVLTSEDIRRSGATSIPEALRLAPGVQVARIDSSKWSVSVRGFSGRYSNKLLVLVDGRSVYAPLFSGVLWDTVNVPVDSIERIEVIRGPGATVWGANAVNGVINIITRSATAALGQRVTVMTGTDDRAQVHVSHGAAVGVGVALKADASFSTNVGFTRQPFSTLTTDAVQAGRFGLRADASLSDRDQVSVQASFVLSNITDGWAMPSLGPALTVLSTASSRHWIGAVNGEWVRKHAAGATSVRLVVEHNAFREVLAGERRRTIDAEVQRTERVGSRHEMVYGAAIRSTSDRVATTPWFSAGPPQRSISRESAFLQDEVKVLGGRAGITVGAKVEHNSYTGLELQPNLRVMAALSPTQSVWAAVSRAVRLPSRAEVDGQLWLGTTQDPDTSLPVQLTVTGSRANARAEQLVAREVGYRYRIGSTASIDVTAFLNRYDGLRTIGLGQPSFVALPTPRVSLVGTFENSGRRSLHGSEVALDWRPATRLRVTGAYSWLGGQGPDLGGPLPVEDDASAHQSYLRAALNLPARIELDGAIRRVSALRASAVAGYTEADARLGFRLPGLTLSVVGRNLLAPGHVEYAPEAWGLGRALVPRAVTVLARVSR